MTFESQHGTPRATASVALTAAVTANILALISLLLAAGSTNWWAVAATCLAAIGALAGSVLALRRTVVTAEPSIDPVPPNASPDPADDPGRLALVEDVVELFDELDRHRDALADGERGLADHVSARLAEILERSDVDVITGDEPYDRSLHAADSAHPVPGAAIADVVSVGFVMDRRVLRRARVRLGEPGERR